MQNYFFEVDHLSRCRLLNLCIASHQEMHLPFIFTCFSCYVEGSRINIKWFLISIEMCQSLLTDKFQLKCQCELFLTEEVNTCIETTSTGVTNPYVSTCIAAQHQMFQVNKFSTENAKGARVGSLRNHCAS